MEIKTSELRKIANLAIKACGQNSQIPITELFGLRTLTGDKKSYLLIGATDTINCLYAKLPIDSDESFDVCVNANIFTQLLNKFTTENVSLTVDENSINLVADGEYKLEIALLDNGEKIIFPENANVDKNKIAKLKFSTISVGKFKELKKFGESALAVDENEVDLNGYYIDEDTLISTNKKIMVAIESDLGKDIHDNVLRRKLVDLICESEDKEIDVAKIDDKTFLVADSTMNIYSTINSPAENYPLKIIKGLINDSKFTVSYKLNPKKLINILDRINLMVTKYDSNIIELTILGENLLISSIKSTGSELLELELSQGDITEEFNWSTRINCDWLREELSTFDDEVEMFIGNDICIKLVNKNVSKLISVLQQ